MSSFQPGDVVDITIRGAKVSFACSDTIEVDIDDYRHTIYPECPGVTVTRRAPQPQAGELWEHPKHGRMLFTDFSGDLWAWDMQESGHALSGLDMSGARRLYPLPVPAAAEAVRPPRCRMCDDCGCRHCRAEDVTA